MANTANTAAMTTTAKKLNMVFTRGESGAKTISLSNPRDGISAGEVRGVMQDIIDKDVFHFDTGFPIDGIKRAYIRETVVTELPEA